jgi:polysaccharide export outer membrane protein
MPLYLLLFLTFCSCLRYIQPIDVPSVDSKEVTRLQDTGTSNVVNIVADDALFFAADRTYKERLATLVAARTTFNTEVSEPRYKIGPGDLLEISVFDIPEMNQAVRVRPDGKATLSLIGEVDLNRLTEDMAEEVIAKKLVRYVKSPQVSVFIKDYQAHTVSILGEVAKPGNYPLKLGAEDLLGLLSTAGGRSDRASSSLVLIPEGKPGTEREVGIEIALEDLTGGLKQAPVTVPLLPGDVVIVPEAGRVEVDGEVNEPGSFPLSAKTSLLGAIAAAGGLTYSADINQVQIIRDIGDGQKALKNFDLENLVLNDGGDARLRNGDIIKVTSTTTRFVARQLVEAINRVVNFGVNRQVRN